MKREKTFVRAIAQFIRAKWLLLKKPHPNHDKHYSTRALLSSIALAVCLSACQKLDDESPPANPEPSLVATLEPLPTPNQYRVRLKWHSHDAPDSWAIYRLGNANQLSVVFLTSDSATREFVHSPVDGGQSLTYELRAIKAGTSKSVASVSVETPKDHVVSGETSAHGVIRANRFYLDRGSLLQTHGRSLRIEANELVSDSGTIDTTPIDVPYRAAGTHGKPAGEIVIVAKSASGKLTLVGNGQDGLEGDFGRNGRDGPVGEEGTPGVYDVKPDNQLPLPQSLEERIRLKAYYSTKRYDDPLARWDLWFFCALPTGDGKKGGDGENAEDGKEGGNGGDAAKIIVRIEKDLGLEVETKLIPGKGAIGGRGGNGGAPGPGGPAGRRDNGHICQEAKPGPPGLAGLQGRPGKFGVNGRVQGICIQIGPRVQGNCP